MDVSSSGAPAFPTPWSILALFSLNSAAPPFILFPHFGLLAPGQDLVPQGPPWGSWLWTPGASSCITLDPELHPSLSGATTETGFPAALWFFGSLRMEPDACHPSEILAL